MINEVVLVGRVGKDPEFHAFDNGGAVARVSLATTERGYKLQNGTEVPERTDWHTVVVRNRTAEVARDYVRKGMLVGVSGSLRYRQYEANGEKRQATEVHADTMKMLSPKERDGETTTPAEKPAQTESRAMEREDNLPF